MSACCGFMFVVNLCSLPFVVFCYGVFGFFSLPKFSSYPVSFFLLNFFFFSYSPSFFLSSVSLLFFVLFCLPFLFYFYVVIL